LNNPLLAYNFNLEDLNNNPSSSYYNLLFNYAKNGYDGSLNYLPGIISSFTDKGTLVNTKFGTGCYYGRNGKNGDIFAVYGGNWLNVPQFNIPSITVNSGISVSLWFYISSTNPQGYTPMFFYFNPVNYNIGNGIRVSISTNYYNLLVGGPLIYNSAGDSTYQSNASSLNLDLFNSKWNHLVMTFQTIQVTPSNITNLSIYINNVLITSYNIAGSYPTGAMNYNYIGSYGMANSNTSGFPGYIDNFRFYTSVLTASQVTTLYNDTTGYA